MMRRPEVFSRSITSLSDTACLHSAFPRAIGSNPTDQIERVHARYSEISDLLHAALSICSLPTASYHITDDPDAPNDRYRSTRGSFTNTPIHIGLHERHLHSKLAQSARLVALDYSAVVPEQHSHRTCCEGFGMLQLSLDADIMSDSRRSEHVVGVYLR